MRENQSMILSPLNPLLTYYYSYSNFDALCPSFENADSLTQTQLFKRLTDPCRFDRIQRPESKFLLQVNLTQKYKVLFLLF